MAKEFKQLLGTRIYLEIPKMKESNLVIDQKLKEEQLKEDMKKFSRLKVYAVGDSETLIKPGDEVLVNLEALNLAPIIPLSSHKSVILFPRFEVIHIW